MSQISSDKQIHNLYVQATRSQESDISMLQNATFINFWYVSRTYQKENYLQVLITHFFSRIFSLCQLAIINLLSFQILNYQNITNVYMLLQEYIQILEMVFMILVSIKYICLFTIIISTKRQNSIYMLFLKFMVCTRLLNGPIIAFSSFMLGKELFSTLLFFFAVMYTIIQNLLLGNFVQRKNLLYCCNIANNIFLSLKVLLNITVNALFINGGSDILKYSIVLMSIVYLWWFTKGGFFTYLNKLIRLSQLFFSVLYIAQVVMLIVSMVSSRQIKMASLVFQIIIASIVIYFFLKVNEEFKPETNYLSAGQLKMLQLRISKGEFNQEIRLNNFYHGFIFVHQNLECNNQKCYTHTKQVYDSLSHTHFSYQNKKQAVQLRLKLIIKCLYETLMRDQPQNKDLILNFLEFSCNELKNQWKFFYLYRRLVNLNPTFLQKMRIQVMFLLMKQQKQSLNSRIYKSKMQIQHVLKAQDTFINLLSLIRKYFFTQRKLVRYLTTDENIETEYIKKLAVKSFSLLELVRAQWKTLNVYWKNNSKWAYYRMICYLFLFNQPLDKKMIQNMQKHELDQSQSKPIILSQNQRIQNQNTLFHFQSFYIHATSMSDGIVIKKMSMQAEQYLKYDKNQLIGSKIQRLMPLQTKLIHSTKLKHWFQRGFSVNQYTYEIKFTKVVNKLGDEIEAVKFFKILLTEEGTLDYICLIKINSVQDHELMTGSEKQLKKVFYFSSYMNSFDEIQPERLGIFLQSEKTLQVKRKSRDKKKDRNQTNIFIRNENLLTIVQNFRRLTPVKTLSRIFSLSIIVFMMITAQNTNNELNTTTTYSSNYLTYMTAYRLPILLDINYMKTILNMGNQTTIKAQIKSQTTQFLSLLGTPSVINTVSDKLFNRQQKFYPIPADDANKNASYDQIDLLYRVASSITSLAKLPINRTGNSFRNLNAYLFPSFSTLMNDTKYAFHDNFQEMFSSSQDVQIKILIIFVILTILFFSFLLYKVKIAHQTLGSVTQILCTMQPNYLLKMQNYFDFLFLSFEKFASIYQLQHSCSQVSDLFFNNNQRLNRNNYQNQSKKNSKNIIQDAQMSRFRIHTYILFIFLCAMCTVFIVSSKIITVKNLKDLATFEQGGFSFLRYYPTAPIVGLGVFDKYYTSLYPQQKSFYPQKYKNGLIDMYKFGLVPYMNDDIQQTTYYLKRRNYFFSNPCTYNPEVLVNLGINLTQCEAVFNGTYKRGLISYFRIAYKIGNGYINGNLTLNASEITQFALGVSITSTYILDAIATWSSEFTQRVNLFKLSTKILALCCFLLILLMHTILLQWLVFWRMQRNYEIEIKMLNHFIPEVVLKEKVIFHQLINKGLIQN